MTYCISDIHGEYDLFMRLLERIRYSDSDKLIVCGDMIDKGKASVRLAKTIFDMPNAYCIMGNHEHMFYRFYRSKMDSANPDFDAILCELQQYFPEDGALLDWDTVDRLVELPYYMDAKYYTCVHAGLPLDREGRTVSPKEAAPEVLLYDRRFHEPNVLPANSKCVLFGHTPTVYLKKEPQILTYPKIGCRADSQSILDYCKIHLDTGVSLSGVLGCFRINDCRVFYVKKNSI